MKENNKSELSEEKITIFHADTGLAFISIHKDEAVELCDKYNIDKEQNEKSNSIRENFFEIVAEGIKLVKNKLTDGTKFVIGERNKAIEKGWDIRRDFRVNTHKQLTIVASLLLHKIENPNEKEEIIDLAVREKLKNEIGWEIEYVKNLMILPYSDRVRIAASLCIAELDRLEEDKRYQEWCDNQKDENDNNENDMIKSIEHSID